MSTARAGGFKKVTKVAAPDGTLHDNQAAAVEWMRSRRIQEALLPFGSATPETHAWVEKTDEGAEVVYVGSLPAFLFEHRVAILAALNQQVPVRKARIKKPAKVIDLDKTLTPGIAAGLARASA